MFSSLLHEADAQRASEVAIAVLAHGLKCALAGGLAIAAQLRAHGRAVQPKRLGDIHLVVDGFDAIPASLAGSFLLNNVHPDAAEGQTLVQLIDERHAVRVDLFRAFGNTLSRARVLDGDTGTLHILSIEDLVADPPPWPAARCDRGGRLTSSMPPRFAGCGDSAIKQRSAAAWNDHRQSVPGTLDEAVEETLRLLEAHPELLVDEEYSAKIVPCGRCRAHGVFEVAPASRILEVLGYW